MLAGYDFAPSGRFFELSNFGFWLVLVLKNFTSSGAHMPITTDEIQSAAAAIGSAVERLVKARSNH